MPHPLRRILGLAFILAGAWAFVAGAHWNWPWGALLGFCVFIGMIQFGAYWVHFPANQYARRLAANQCLHCGYSLTGNVSGFCPECGSIVTPADSNAP